MSDERNITEVEAANELADAGEISLLIHSHLLASLVAHPIWGGERCRDIIKVK